MAWPFLTGVVKIIVTYRIGGKLAVNVTFAKRTGGDPLQTGDLALVADAVALAWWTNWSPAASNEAEVETVECVNWEASGGSSKTIIPDPSIIGDKTGGIVTNQVAAVVSHRTAKTGRSHRGRSYIPGLDEEDLDATKIITAQVITDLGEIFTLLDSELGLVNFNHIVYSLYEDGAPRVEPEANATTEYIVDPNIKTQRRRLPKAT